MKKFISAACGAALALGLCCGCGQQQKPLQLVKVNEVTHSVFYAPQYAAMSQGFFADEGIQVELTNGGGADKVMTAVLTGQSHIGLAGPEACIYVLNQGKEESPQVFAQLTRRDGSFLVGRTGGDFSWEDLRGKTIIGGRKGGMPEMTLEFVMAQNGVIPHVDAAVDTSVQFNMMAGAFTGGFGDYVTLFEPTATEMELEGKGFILASMGLESGEIPYTAYFANGDYIQGNSDLIQRFTNAVARGLEWCRQSDPALVAQAVADQFPDTDLEVLTQVVERYQQSDVWNETPVMKEEALERLQDVMEHAGELSPEQRVDFDDLVDNSFAQKVK